MNTSPVDLFSTDGLDPKGHVTECKPILFSQTILFDLEYQTLLLFAAKVFSYKCFCKIK